MNRYQIDDVRFSNGDIVYYIFDNYAQDYIKKEYTDFDIVEEDLDLLNEGNQIELATY
jgi:hypothetical protein